MVTLRWRCVLSKCSPAHHRLLFKGESRIHQLSRFLHLLTGKSPFVTEGPQNGAETHSAYLPLYISTLRPGHMFLLPLLVLPQPEVLAPLSEDCEKLTMHLYSFRSLIGCLLHTLLHFLCKPYSGTFTLTSLLLKSPKMSDIQILLCIQSQDSKVACCLLT